MDIFVELLDERCIQIEIGEHDTYKEVLELINKQCDHNYTMNNIHDEDLEIPPQCIINILKLKPGYELDIFHLKERGLWNIESFIDCEDKNLLPVYLSHFDVNVVDKYDYSIFKKAVSRNDPEILSILLDIDNINIDIKLEIFNCLNYSIKKKYDEIAKMLVLRTNIDQNVEYSFPHNRSGLEYAVINNNRELIELLLQHRACDTNSVSQALILALKNKSNNYKLIIDEDNIDVNMKNDVGCTALIYACEYGNVDAVEKIIKKKDPM